MAIAPDVAEYITDRVEETPIVDDRKPSTSSAAPRHWTKAHAAEHFQLNTQQWKNQALTVSCQPTYWHKPETKQQICEILEYARKHDENVKVVGAGHSLSDIACTDGHLISLERFCRVLNIDRRKCVVKVESGILISLLSERLQEVGLALRNTTAIASESIAGALSTGAHGTGICYGVLASDVLEIEIILADGSEVSCSRENKPHLFLGALCSLGALGVISTITIQCEPIFHLDAVQFPLPFETVLSDINKIVSSAEHVRIWWFPHTEKCIVWQANRARRDHAPPSPSLRRTLNEIKEKLIGHYCLEFAYFMANYNETLIPYVNRLYRRLLYNKTKAEQDLSFKIFSFDTIFKQYTHECSIPLENVYPAMLTFKKMLDAKKYRVHFPIEIKFVKGDDIWLSPAYGGDRAYISVIMNRPYGIDVPHTKYFNEFEQKMSALGGRPQWGKSHNWTRNECRASYPKFDEFVNLRNELDPNKLFYNEYLGKIFGSEQT